MSEQNTYCKLSDEEIKLEILKLKCGDFTLGDLTTQEKQGLEEIFQWVKGE